MYSRNLFDICISGYIFIVLLQFSRRTYHVRTAKTSLYNKNLSAKSIYHKIPRVHLAIYIFYAMMQACIYDSSLGTFSLWDKCRGTKRL